MWAEGIFVAKRLECAGFSGAVERAKNLERRVILVWTESGAEVTAVQTLRPFFLKSPNSFVCFVCFVVKLVP
jgi:hypothetical protein